MIALDISPEERQSGQMTPERLAQALRALDEDGFVVLNDVVDLGHIATLRERMFADLAAFLARPDAPFNFNTGNVQQEAPPTAPYLFRDVLVNDLVISVTKAVLGAGVKNAFYSGNTAVPGGTQRQPVHPDVAQLWPHLEHATPPFGLVVNVPVVDMTPENGSTEIWPGTHRDTTLCVQMGDIKVPAETLEARRKVVPPIQPSVRAGSVLIRDIRMWHAGMPNRTDTPRPMIAMIHWISWWRDFEPLVFPKGTEAFFVHPDLTTVARFTDAQIDYVRHGGAYDFMPGKDGT